MWASGKRRGEVRDASNGKEGQSKDYMISIGIKRSEEKREIRRGREGVEKRGQKMHNDLRVEAVCG